MRESRHYAGLAEQAEQIRGLIIIAALAVG